MKSLLRPEREKIVEDPLSTIVFLQSEKDFNPQDGCGKVFKNCGLEEYKRLTGMNPQVLGIPKKEIITNRGQIRRAIIWTNSILRNEAIGISRDGDQLSHEQCNQS